MTHRKKGRILMLRNYVITYSTSLFLALMYTLFVLPLHILDGGLMGVSMILHYLQGWNTGAVYLLINAPILVWAFFVDRTLFNRSIFGMLSFSFNMYLLSPLENFFHPNELWGLVFSGIFIGIGYAILGSLKASISGMALIGIKLEELRVSRLSIVLFITDFIVVFMGGFIFDWKQFFLSVAFIVLFTLGIELANMAQNTFLVRKNTNLLQTQK